MVKLSALQTSLFLIMAMHLK